MFAQAPVHLCVAWVPKPQSSWMNKVSILVVSVFMKVGEYYRRRYNISEDKYQDPFLNKLVIHNLPFNLILKYSPEPVKESIGTMTAHAMGLPVPRVLCYTHDGPKRGGHILMTRIPGESLWDAHISYSDEELADIIAEVSDCLKQIRCFASPYGNAVCGPDGQEMYTRAVPDGTWTRRESPGEYHDDLIIAADIHGDLYQGRLAEVKRLKDKSHRVVFGHGDLHLSNIMVQDGHLSGIIDWGSAGWYPDYWDFVLPMSPWPDEWGWAVDLLYSMPGGKEYEQERKSYDAFVSLAGYVFA